MFEYLASDLICLITDTARLRPAAMYIIFEWTLGVRIDQYTGTDSYISIAQCWHIWPTGMWQYSSG